MNNAAEQIILITGATAGLGRRVAEELAATGAILLLHGRNQEKGESVLEKINAATGNGQLHYYNADFSCLAEVRQLAETITADQPRLDVLIDNAGIGAGPSVLLRHSMWVAAVACGKLSDNVGYRQRLQTACTRLCAE